MRTLALVLAACTLAIAGCGGGSGPKTSGKANDKLSVSASGWKTDLSRHIVPLGEFAAGGPGKDGIPAIDGPRFLRASDVDWIAFPEPVIELKVNGETRAYPIQILIWHEIVNDEVGGVPVAVTFCPLCNTALAFERRVDGTTLSFGTTGNLRNSDLVMYDRQTESWWQQFGGTALVGRYAGTRLRQLPARIVSWREFSKEHPRALVLDRPSPTNRPYGQNPYAGYDDVSSPPFFPAARAGDRRLLPKERVAFIERGDESVAVPFSVLAKKRTMKVEVGGRRLTITWRPGVTSALDAGYIARGRDVGSADVRNASGRRVDFDQPFWFAVAAFRPNVKIVR